MTTEIEQITKDYVPSVGVLTPPKPEPGMYYIGAAVQPSHPDHIYGKIGLGYEIVKCKKAVSVLGFADRPFGQGGLLDKTSDFVTNGDTVLMECTLESAVNMNMRRMKLAADIKGIQDDAFQEAVEQASAIAGVEVGISA